MVSESFYRNGTESSANCTAEGYPRPNFLWFKGNNQVTRNSKLYFSKILVSDAGSYRCQVDNVIGMKSIHVDVNVTCKSFYNWHFATFRSFKFMAAFDLCIFGK